MLFVLLLSSCGIPTFTFKRYNEFLEISRNKEFKSIDVKVYNIKNYTYLTFRDYERDKSFDHMIVRNVNTDVKIYEVFRDQKISKEDSIRFELIDDIFFYELDPDGRPKIKYENDISRGLF